MKELLFSVALAAALSASTAELYKNDFEQTNDVRFYSVCAPRWISSQSVAEKEGFIKVHRARLSEFGEQNHDGVLSWALDISLLKGDGKWGPSCMYRGGKFKIPVDRPLWLSAYVYPDLLPPDVTISMGVVFTFEKDGKRVGGSLPIPALGYNQDHFLVYCGNIQDLVKRFDKVILESWMVRLHSRKAFHGQRVRLFLDDVVLSDTKPDISSVRLSNERQGNDIRNNDPYAVNYTSLYREFPKTASNVVFNSSFELGMRDWYPRATRAEDSLELPDPAKLFQVIEAKDAPHGKRVFAVTRGGRQSNVVLSGRPYKIEEGKDYVLSFYAKSSKDGDALRVCSRNVKLTRKWKRYTISLPKIACFQTWRGKKFPGRFNLTFSGKGDSDFCLDAIQLQKAPLTDYSGPGILEISARPVKQFGLYGENEKPEFKVCFFNSDSKPRQGVLRWEWKDHRHKAYANGERRLSAGARQGGSFTLPMPGDQLFGRLHLTLNAPGQPEQTFVTSAARIPDLAGIRNNEFFGHSTLEADNPPNLKYTLDLNKKLGMSFAMVYHLNHPRAPENWKQNNPLWNKIDRLLKICDAYNTELIWSNYPPFPPTVKRAANGVEIITPEIENEVRDYAEEMGRRYRGKIRYYEYFGEYLKDSLPQQIDVVNRLLKAAAEGLKKGNPDAILLTPGQHRMDSILTVFPMLAKKGALRYADRLTLHPYGFGTSLTRHETMEELKKQIRQYVPGMKVINTEAGSCSADVLYYDDICGETLNYPAYCTELEQAIYGIRGQLAMFGSGIFEKSAIFYSYEGNVHGRKFYHFVNPDHDISPRPIFPAYVQLVKRMSGTKNVCEFQQRSRNGLQGYLFRKDNRLFAALWRYTAEHTARKVLIPLAADKVSAWDLIGNPIRLPGGSQTELMVDDEPVWLELSGVSEADARKAFSSIRVIQTTPELSGESGRVKIRIDNPDSAELAGTLLVNGKTVAGDVRIAPGSRYETTVPLERDSAYQAVFQMKSGEEFKSETTRFFPIAKASGKIAMDGSLAEFAKAVPFRMDRRHAYSNFGVPVKNDLDLSAVVRALYDSENFYLAVDVQDDIHRIPHETGNYLWANDALQLSFVLSGNRNTLSDGIVELAVSDTKSGPKAVFTYGAKSGKAAVSAKITRRGTVTAYKLAIPWKTLDSAFTPSADKNPLFNLAVSDNDGHPQKQFEFLKGYEKSIQMGKGIVDSKNPAGAFRLIFE